MSRPRPRWASTLWLWLTDGQYDAAGSDWHYMWRGWLETPGVKALCFTFGHKPIPDQCNKPEHDLCVFCNKLMPYKAERRSA